MTWSPATSSASRVASSSGGGVGSSYSALKSCSSCAAAASPLPPELPVNRLDHAQQSAGRRRAEVTCSKGVSTVYVLDCGGAHAVLLENLGPHTTGVGCGDIRTCRRALHFELKTRVRWRWTDALSRSRKLSPRGSLDYNSRQSSLAAQSWHGGASAMSPGS